MFRLLRIRFPLFRCWKFKGLSSGSDTLPSPPPVWLGTKGGESNAGDFGLGTVPLTTPLSTKGEVHRSMEAEGSLIPSSSMSESPTKLTSSHTCSQSASMLLSAPCSQDTVVDRFSSTAEMGTLALLVEVFPSGFPSPFSTHFSLSPSQGSSGEMRTVCWTEGDRGNLLLTAGGTLKSPATSAPRSAVDDSKG